MTKNYYIIFLILFLTQQTFTQDSIKVNFIVNAKNLNDSSKVFISGNNPSLGNWNPSKVLLLRINDSTWQKTLSFNRKASLEYKFTLGSWNNEALNADGSVPSNHTLQVVKDTTILISISKWKHNDEQKNIQTNHRYCKILSELFRRRNQSKRYNCLAATRL